MHVRTLLQRLLTYSNSERSKTPLLGVSECHCDCYQKWAIGSKRGSVVRGEQGAE